MVSGAGWYFEVNELILLEEEQARRALEEERMRMEEHARQREQMIGGPPRGMSHSVKERARVLVLFLGK